MLSDPWAAYLAFMGSFYLSFVLGMIQGNDSWILLLGVSYLMIHQHYNGMHIGIAPVFASFFKGVTGGDGVNVMDFLVHLGLQFAGALVGAIVFVLITGLPSAMGDMSLIFGDGKLFIFFLFGNMIQGGAFSLVDTKDTSLQGCFSVASVYVFSWTVMQFSFPGAVGGLTIDFARQLASKLLESDLYGPAFDKFWVALLSGFAGLVAGCAMNMVEGKLRNKGGDEAAAEAN